MSRILNHQMTPYMPTASHSALSLAARNLRRYVQAGACGSRYAGGPITLERRPPNAVGE